MGNTPSIEGKETFIQSKYGVNPDRIKVIKGQYYFTLDREKYKLPKEVLKTFEYTNDFFFFFYNDAPPVEQNKKLYNMKFH